MLQPPAPPPQEPSEARLAPLDRFSGSLGQRVYQTLREAILSLAYRPGEIIRKPEICDALGVSRSPVADAVARLAAEGLVDVVPQAGTFVARFSMEEIREGAFLREAIEVAAIERVAETITEDQLTQLRRNITVQAALIADGDVPGFYQTDAAMHELILSFTGFRKLAQVSETAWLHVNRARQLILPVPGRITATLDEHRAILAALESRDPDAARLATRAHLRQLVTYLEPLERDRPDLFDPA
ncbi:GntR family transcriptional regulator [Rhodobacteraceae bacterium HSP-20]|uniref:GntR family transcriptional regulator n=1 Tax=Paragemmobacter amnigenus TaxID=2852097 RepID=A0ABS6J121_9RHOB|nr:GntR family transcriptional regulator [Rhodobacter amnigenus]MBU9696584.1 GntR family transcriptional regulator [Rhodobacter amnigenus]MBV4387811.1 GntR family transcriptional regulator [Rhodobacter amnigenus]